MKRLFVIFGAALLFLISTSTVSFATPIPGTEYNFGGTDGLLYEGALEDFTVFIDGGEPIDYAKGKKNAGDVTSAGYRAQGTYLGTIYGEHDSDAVFLAFLKHHGIDCLSLKLIGKSDATGDEPR